jgi:alkylation response protein AidB-like acyl-CoA dehydrogenase
MDLRYSKENEAFRADVRSFLAAHWPPRGEAAQGNARQRAIEFRRKAIEAGYLARGYPRKYGGSEQPADVLKASIISEEFGRVDAPLDRAGIISPTILNHGAEWQKQRFIGPTLLGEILWCQGYSEPGSGSDLASLQTRGELVGEEWVINGQKIWTSGAQNADYIFCLVRTEPDATKHAGISYLLVDMKQPGIEVRPLKQMTGASGFNQVFFTGARTPRDWIVGKRGEGWLVSRTTLKHERGGTGRTAGGRRQIDGLLRLARRAQRGGRPAIEDPEIRQRLAQLEGYIWAHYYSNLIMLTRAAKDESPGILGLMNKIMGTNVGHEVAKLSVDLLGGEGLLSSPSGGAPRGGRLDDAGWVTSYMGSLGRAILAGTSNIQRNIIAERGLGLPRDSYAQTSP